MALDKDDLKKLSPEQRIKKLKEYEEERKKELEETEDLIRRAEVELERNRDIPNIEVPKIEPVDISRMFESGAGLETQVEASHSEERPELNPIKYIPESVQESAEPMFYAPAALEEMRQEPSTKIEDTVKYESATDQADKLTGSRGTLKNIKKYTMG